MNKRTLSWIILLLIILFIGILALTVYHRVANVTATLDVVLTDTMLTRTAIAGD